MKLLLLVAFVLPSLVPAGFMAQRNTDTLAFEIALCPSGFSQLAIKALSPPASVNQSHHAHHHVHSNHLGHHADAGLSGAQSDQTDGLNSHASHGVGESAELCPLAGPGSIIADTAVNFDLAFLQSLNVYSDQTLSARAAALLPPPVRGPPILS